MKLIKRTLTEGFSFTRGSFQRKFSGALSYLREIKSVASTDTALRACRSCSLRKDCKQVVLPEGPPDAEYMFVGRSPGKKEDVYGKPFFPGTAVARVLDSYLKELNIKKSQVYLSNVVHCAPEGNRSLSIMEKSVCSVWKIRELELNTGIKYIFLMGNDAVEQFMGTGQSSVVEQLGKYYEFDTAGRRFYVFPIYHPANFLRRPQDKIKVSRYLREVRTFIENINKERLDESE